MSLPPPQLVQLNCPQCRTPLRVPLVTLIDVGVQPELKPHLLAGQLNMAVCPACRTAAMLSAPLIYHDPAKQLFLVHFPQQANARPEEQERFIGDATSAVMRTLPPNTPRGYLLAPRRFLSLNSLIDAVLEADGISREMLEAQHKRVELLSQLAEAFEQGEEPLAQLVEHHKDALDHEFFRTLAAFIQASAQTDRGDSAQLLQSLFQKLIELTGFDINSLGELAGADEDDERTAAIERLRETPDEDLEHTIGELRPVIDYSFFEAWTQQIEAAEQAGDKVTAERLTARRARILEVVERMDRQAQEIFEQGARLLNEVMQASDPAETLRSQRDQIDEAFLLVIDANIGAAERAGRSDAVTRLQEIRRLAIEIVQESLSPEDRFINELLQADPPQGATKLLRQNPTMITTAFVKRLNELADQSQQEGHTQMAERLRQLAREAGAMLF